MVYIPRSSSRVTIFAFLIKTMFLRISAILGFCMILPWFVNPAAFCQSVFPTSPWTLLRSALFQFFSLPARFDLHQVTLGTDGL